MHESIKLHLEEVRTWLDENVRLYPTPKQLTLHSFIVDLKTLSGSFKMILDDIELPEKLYFHIDQAGKAIYSLPMFHSPLGVPASYPMLELTEKTSEAILRGLRSSIPRVMGYGINFKSGKEVSTVTPIEDRIIDIEEFRSFETRINAHDFSVTIKT